MRPRTRSPPSGTRSTATARTGAAWRWWALCRRGCLGASVGTKIGVKLGIGIGAEGFVSLEKEEEK